VRHGRAYVATGTEVAPITGSIAVIDTANNKLLTTIVVGTSAQGVAVTPCMCFAQVVGTPEPIPVSCSSSPAPN
jgi:hypothetical protein